MGKIEQFKIPDIQAQKLLQIIENIKWEDMEKIEYNGTNFLLFLIDQTSESDNHSDASFFRSTAINGFDIYILKSLPYQIRQRKIFHEMLEANLREQGFDNQASHQLALEEEQKIFGARKE